MRKPRGKPHLEKILSVPFCGGELVLYRPVFPMKHYDAAGSPNERETRLPVVFREESVEQEIAALAELGEIARRRNCHVEAGLQGHEAGFATIVSTLLGTGRVIDDTEFYSFIEQEFAIRIADSLPRLEDGKLCFLAAEFRLDRKYGLREVSIDLTSFQEQIFPLVRRDNMDEEREP